MIPHIESLPTKQLLDFLYTSNEYTITQKIDGSQLLFGIDDHGFYTSRETKGGQRIYDVADYSICFSSSYMRSTHLALQNVLTLMCSAGLKIDTQIEVEVLYGEIPNAIPYLPEINRIVFLRNTIGNIDISALSDILNNIEITIQVEVPYTTDGLQIQRKTENSKWIFSDNPIFTMPDEVSEYLKGFIDTIRACNTKERIIVISKLKSYLVNKLIHGTDSVFGPSIINGGWIEGIVLRHKKAGIQIKIVDETTFTIVRNFLWKVRDELTKKPYHIDRSVSFFGSLLIDLFSLINHPILGTKQSKKYLNGLDNFDSIIVGLDFLSLQKACVDLISLKEHELLDILRNYSDNKDDIRADVCINNINRVIIYNDTIDARTKQVFSVLFSFMKNVKFQIENSNDTRQLVLILMDSTLSRY